MNSETFLFDTYALMEIIKNNKNYSKYLEKRIIINDFIFAEFCYALLKDKANDMGIYTDEVKSAIAELNPEIIEEAMKFRYKYKKKKLSMPDCISYIMAKELGIKFLTGDKEFEKMDNVEFVK